MSLYQHAMDAKAREDTRGSKHQAVMRELVAVLASATPLGRDIGSYLARFHGPVCPGASAECGMNMDTCSRCAVPTCMRHLRWCGVCDASYCSVCTAGENPMLLLPIHTESDAMAWTCESHVVICAPVCMPSAVSVRCDRCYSCHRGMCLFHSFGRTEAVSLSPWDRPRVCNQCVRVCVECNVPLYRTSRADPASPAYKASMCYSCHHGPDAPLMKRHKIE